jgi:5-hydroxyisourate hydrolase
MTNLMDRRKVLGAASLAAGTCLLGSGEAEAEPARGNLTVHVLDLYSGSPAKGVKVDLFMRRGEHLTSLKSVATDTDGRSGTLLEGDAFAAGRYLLMFDLSDYFKGANETLAANFYRKLSMEFEVTDATLPVHIPLQCTPWTQTCSVLPG